MVKNIEETDSVSFGFMMPLGTSSNNHRAFYDMPDLYVQNMDGIIYKFEDEDFSGDCLHINKKTIDQWIAEIHTKQDNEFWVFDTSKGEYNYSLFLFG